MQSYVKVFMPPPGTNPGSPQLRTEKKLTDTSVLYSLATPDEKLGAQKKRTASQGLALPPRRDMTPHVQHVFRYACSTGTNPTPITVGSLVGAMGGIALTSTSIQPWVGSLRLKWVRVYSGTSSTGFTICQLAWAASSGYFTPDEEWNQMAPEGSAAPTVNTFSPPAHSMASAWLNGNTALTTPLFRITVPPGSILDVSVEYRLSNQFIYAPYTVATATAGQVYYGYLDGAVSHLFQPQGVPTTF